ncbi:MAG: RibD family protein [Cyclobacteriaceae bacterium]
MKTERYWPALLKLAEKLKESQEPVRYCFLSISKRTQIYINQLPEAKAAHEQLLVVLHPEELRVPEATSVFLLEGFSAQPHHTYELDEDAAKFLKLYLPYCFLSLSARQLGRAIAISHFAQSLDGRIATHSGDSRWIGNQENLVHAHRMRALCDGILIGANTLNCDQPALTVRLVEGKNPRRIVLCSSEADFSSLQKCEDEVLLVGSCDDPQIPQTSFKYFSPNQKGRIDCQQLLQYLYQEGIYSVYVEGGASTTSGFLEDKAADVVQLHFSPLIFGSGVNSFCLPEISEVKEAIQFERFSFCAMGDSCMFVGEMIKD